MTISYQWLSAYLPLTLEPQRLSQILTSVGLEVEKMERFEEVKGNLEGLFIGEVLHTEQHPNADKLKLTRVNVGGSEPLQIVCGAPNVAPGQKVVVAPVGATIYPLGGDPLTMKLAKIRGTESQGMICAEDEIGLGSSHAGIMVLDEAAVPGSSAREYFKPYEDIIYEIGLTPNRMDAMSHWGVARDVCAYLSHHDGKEVKPVLPDTSFSGGGQLLRIGVRIEDEEACPRYSGVCIAGVKVGPSPKWLADRLKSIGLRPINNIVDITNFIQHETGQPLHAFDYDKIGDATVIIKKLPNGTSFKTLDDKERKLHEDDLMICDSKGGMCIAGVFGGSESGVTESTVNIFLESACFDGPTIRKTSFRHGLRTDAATRFEKGIDISKTVTVAQRAAMLITEIAGGSIASDIIDLYPAPREKKTVTLSFAYLKRLSGKDYSPEAVKRILQSLGFVIAAGNEDALQLEVPFHKPDVSLPADIVEEILRIDGLDNIAIPTNISIAPAVEENDRAARLKEKLSLMLTGLGFSEILTNSITYSGYFSEAEKEKIVRLLNNLSAELDVLRPSMVHTALSVVAFNVNRKNANLSFFEFGKTYHTEGPGNYSEQDHLSLYLTGAIGDNHWKGKGKDADIYYLKGVVQSLLKAMGLNENNFVVEEHPELEQCLSIRKGSKLLVAIGRVKSSLLSRFDLKAPVLVADFNWTNVLKHAAAPVRFREIPKFPLVERDLAIVVPASVKYVEIEQHIAKLRLGKLKSLRLFDVFQSEKLGAGKKSLAINFTFGDEEKTLTDKEIESWMQKIMTTLEKDGGAEIRK